MQENTKSMSVQKQRAIIRQLRHEALESYRPLLQKGIEPIRVMARMVAATEQHCRALNITEEVLQSELVNRTIGDVDLRRVSEYEGEAGDAEDYRMLADELGIALPGEQLHGHVASGKTYLLLREYMMEYEHLLLKQHIDLRLYDLFGVGNPLLRSWLADDWREWGFSINAEQVYLSQGALNGIDRILKGFRGMYDEQGLSEYALVCPAPGFGVPEQQARLYGYRVHRIQTDPANCFKVTASQLDEALRQAPDIHIIR